MTIYKYNNQDLDELSIEPDGDMIRVSMYSDDHEKIKAVSMKLNLEEFKELCDYLNDLLEELSTV